MIQFYPTSESIYYDRDISLVWKWIDEAYIKTFHGVYVEVVKPWAWMGIFSMLIFWQSSMLSLIFPCIFQILKKFKCTFKSIMAKNGVVQHANFGVLRYSMCNADKIYSGEYSSGELIILLQNRHERGSVISLSTPDMNSKAKLTQCLVNSLNTTLLRPLFFTIFLFHATIIIEGEGIGARSVRFPHRFYVCPTRLRKWGIRTQSHMYVWSCLFPLNHIRV